MSPKLKATFKQYFDAGYRQLFLTEIPKDNDMVIYFLLKCENYTYNGRSTI